MSIFVRLLTTGLIATLCGGVMVLVPLVACGRSEIAGEAALADRFDTGVVLADAGEIDAGAGRDAGLRAGPTHVFIENGGCPRAGVETDLVPVAGERLMLAKSWPLGECSGAGGDWLIGTATTGEQLAFGNHACWFLPSGLRAGSNWFGLTRVAMSPALITTPMGWCLPQVSSRWRVLAWGLYPSERDAVDARAALLGP